MEEILRNCGIQGVTYIYCLGKQHYTGNYGSISGLQFYEWQENRSGVIYQVSQIYTENMIFTNEIKSNTFPTQQFTDLVNSAIAYISK